MRQNTDDTRRTRTCSIQSLLALVGTSPICLDPVCRCQYENRKDGQMTAALTKQHEQEKHTRYRDKDEKNKSRRKQREKQKNRTQGVDSNKACRLCYKAEPGTLPPDLPSSSNSRQQWYQVPVRPLSSPASVNK